MSRRLTIRVPCMAECGDNIEVEITVTSEGYGGSYAPGGDPPEAAEWFMNEDVVICDCGHEHTPDAITESDRVQDIAQAAIREGPDDEPDYDDIEENDEIDH
jgi:hypothetical protein